MLSQTRGGAGRGGHSASTRGGADNAQPILHGASQVAIVEL
jgi:hypothetical protein